MGRPRQFDEANLLDTAIEQFWSKGFDDTSVQNIALVADVGNGSIYAAYGSKRGLFLAAFERYCERRAAFVRDTVLAASGSARSAVLALFRAVIEDCIAQPNRRGCLMINSIAVLAGRIPEVAELGARTTAAMEHSVAERLRRAERDNDNSIVPALSAHIIVICQGLIQSSRLGVPVRRLHEIAEISLTTVPLAWVDDVDAAADAGRVHSR